MARKPSPWFRSERNEWWVRIRGDDHCLGKHPENAAPPRKSTRTGKWNAPSEIEEVFFRLMNGETSEPVVEPAAESGQESVQSVFRTFIHWCEANRGESTVVFYRKHLEAFINFDAGRGLVGLLPYDRLNAGHVTRWLASKPTWGPTARRNAITAVARACNWAVKNNGASRNPIAGIEKPAAHAPREIVTPEEFAQALTHASREFADLLTVSFDCGARPSEVKRIERRHLQMDRSRAVIPASEAKGHKRDRHIYFPTDRSLDIIRRLAEENPSGALFRNQRGSPWTAYAVKCAFARVEIAHGLAEMERKGVELELSEEAVEERMKTIPRTRKNRITGKPVEKKNWEIRREAKDAIIAEQARKHSRRLNHYMFRRGFITRKIIAGVDSHVVAQLSGHQSTEMIDRHYSAVAKDHDFLLEQARRDIHENRG